MVNVGIIREVDNLGRITLPKEFRDYLNIREKSKVDIRMTSDGIYIEPYREPRPMIEQLHKLSREVDKLDEMDKRDEAKRRIIELAALLN